MNWYKTHVDDRPVYLIDTPGFGDTLRTPDDILAEIIDAFGQLYEYSHNKYIDGLIYLHNINDDAVGDVLKVYLLLCSHPTKATHSFSRIIALSRIYLALNLRNGPYWSRRDGPLIQRLASGRD